MPTPVFYPANLQWIGAAKETSYGTPVAAPTFWIPVSSPKYEPNITPLTDDAIRGGMGKEYQQVEGQRYDKLGYTTYPYLDSVFQHFEALLGTPDTVTGSADPYTHTTSVYNGSGTNAAQPPSYTLFYVDGAGKCWQIPGAVGASLKLNVAADALNKIDYEWIGLPATVITPPTNTPTANKPWPGWNSTITVGGSGVTYYNDVTLEYKRATEAIPTITGTQSPYAIFGGEVTGTFDLTGVYQGSASGDLAAFIAGTQPTFSVKIGPAGDAVHSLTLQHSLCAYKSANPEGTNKWMEVKAKGAMLNNSTDATGGGQSLAKVTFLTSASTAF